MPPKTPIPETYKTAMNHLASFELLASNAYLYMAYYYYGDTEPPIFVSFFEDQIEVKKHHAQWFIRYLKERKAKICLPVIKWPDLVNWEPGVRALRLALELEEHLGKLLKELKDLTAREKDRNLKKFLVDTLSAQARNLSNLGKQIFYQERKDKLAQEEAERMTQEKAERLTQEETERLAQQEAERIVQLEAERMVQLEAERMVQQKVESLYQEAEQLAQEETD